MWLICTKLFVRLRIWVIFYATDIALCYRVFQETPEVYIIWFFRYLPMLFQTAFLFISKFEIGGFIDHFFVFNTLPNEFLTASFTRGSISSIIFGGFESFKYCLKTLLDFLQNSKKIWLNWVYFQSIIELKVKRNTLY